MRRNFKEGQELLRRYVFNWRERAGASQVRIGLLGRAKTYLKKVLRKGPAFSTVACVNVLSYHIDFVFKSFVPGARFSKVPVTLRARNQIFKSKYKE